MNRFFVTLVSFFTLVLVISGPASAAPAFGPAQGISTPGTFNVVPHVSLDGAGNMLTTWMSTKLTVGANHDPVPVEGLSFMERRRSVSGKLGAARQVYSAPLGDTIDNAPVSADNESGDVLSAWGGYGSTTINILAGNVRDGYSTDLTKRSIGTSSSGYPEVSISDNGIGIITWSFEQSVGGNKINRIAYVIKEASGNFSDVKTLPAALSEAPSDITTDIDDSGRLAIAYTASKDSYVVRGTVADGLGGQFKLAAIDYYPVVKLSGDGSAVIAGADSNDEVTLVVLDQAGNLSSPLRPDEPAHSDEPAMTVARDGKGGVVLTWLRWASGSTVYTSTYSPDAGISPTRAVKTAGRPCTPPSSSARGGVILTSWADCEQSPPEVPTWQVEAAYFPADGTPATTSKLGDTSFNAFPTTTLDEDGDGVIAWHSFPTNSAFLPEGSAFNTDISIANVTVDHPKATAASVISGLSLKPAKFKVCAKKAKVKTKGRKACGSKLSFRISGPADVVVTIQRVIKRKVKGKAKLVRKTLDKRTLNALAPGANRTLFNGRIGKKSKALKPGRYRLSVVAIDAGGLRSKPVNKAFRVIRKK